jgi:hypothetical protein
MKSESDGISQDLIAFNEEAGAYCRGISNADAGEYARNYARMVINRAMGMEFALPRVPYGLREPDRNLIRSALEAIGKKYFRRN